MNEATVENLVTEALDPETFSLEDYLDDLPVATNTVDIYVNLPKARRLRDLVKSRTEVLEKRRKDEAKGKTESLSLTDDEEDTEYDDEINELVSELEKTKVTFHLQSVAPKLRKSIEKHYEATLDKDASPEDRVKHEQRKNADILHRAISYVALGDGREDRSPWDADRLLKQEETLFEEQAGKLVGALWEMVYTGTVFEEALSADFS